MANTYDVFEAIARSPQGKAFNQGHTVTAIDMQDRGIIYHIDNPSDKGEGYSALKLHSRLLYNTPIARWTYGWFPVTDGDGSIVDPIAVMKDRQTVMEHEKEEERKYNGWPNYETWCANLWIDNSQGDSDFWIERAGTHTRIIDLADEMKGYYTKEVDEILESDGLDSGMISDLLGHAVGMIDWYAIARHYEDSLKHAAIRSLLKEHPAIQAMDTLVSGDDDFYIAPGSDGDVYVYHHEYIGNEETPDPIHIATLDDASDDIWIDLDDLNWEPATPSGKDIIDYWLRANNETWR